MRYPQPPGRRWVINRYIFIRSYSNTIKKNSFSSIGIGRSFHNVASRQQSTHMSVLLWDIQDGLMVVWEAIITFKRVGEYRSWTSLMGCGTFIRKNEKYKILTLIWGQLMCQRIGLSIWQQWDYFQNCFRMGSLLIQLQTNVLYITEANSAKKDLEIGSQQSEKRRSWPMTWL